MLVSSVWVEIHCDTGAGKGEDIKRERDARIANSEKEGLAEQ